MGSVYPTNAADFSLGAYRPCYPFILCLFVHVYMLRWFCVGKKSKILKILLARSPLVRLSLARLLTCSFARPLVCLFACRSLSRLLARPAACSLVPYRAYPAGNPRIAYLLAQVASFAYPTGHPRIAYLLAQVASFAYPAGHPRLVCLLAQVAVLRAVSRPP
jgi:hypothetical protein